MSTATCTAYVIRFRWRTEDRAGTGRAIVAASSAEDAERRWLADDPAERPKYSLEDVEELGDQVVWVYDE
jgi:hypothetical protein